MALKGIEKIIAKFCVETAVYWGNPQNDGFGGFTFDAPVEIKCRWENKTEVDFGWFSAGFPGNVRLSKSSLLVLEDMEEKAYLWKGTLDELEDLYGSDVPDPMQVRDAFKIHRFDKIPMVFKTDEFVRTVWLYDQGK